MAGARLIGGSQIGTSQPSPLSADMNELLLGSDAVGDVLSYSSTTARRLIPHTAKSISLISPSDALIVTIGGLTAIARTAIQNSATGVAYTTADKKLTLVGETFVTDGVIVGDLVKFQDGNPVAATDPQYIGLVSAVAETIITLETWPGYQLPSADMADVDIEAGMPGMYLSANTERIFPVAPYRHSDSAPVYVSAIVASGSNTGTLYITSYV